MKAAIQQRARELGFDDCRFASAAPPETAPQFEAWLAAGYHGTMGYLQRNARQRIDPQLVLPGARSLIALAVSYAFHEPTHPCTPPKRGTDNSRPPRSSPPGRGRGWVHGRDARQFGVEALPDEKTKFPSREAENPLTRFPGLVARYARLADYHEIIGERLKTLARYVGNLGGPGTRSLWYVDTGPLLERDLGQRAGLGFIGKHTNLISRRLGNWFFLSEIITTLPLEADPPEKNHCGSCTRCLTACPTQAIPAPFQLDARRCISYLTIELKGPIPLELRPLMGNRVFGCDDCLAVCPWNRFAREGNLLREHSRPDIGPADLLELLSLDAAAFKKRFANTPIMRSKRRGLLRNVCVALGNLGDARALPELSRATSDPEPLVAEHASWAIDQIQTSLHATWCASGP